MHVVTMMVQWPTGPTPRLTIIDGLRDAATIETGMVNVDPALTRAYDLISE